MSVPSKQLCSHPNCSRGSANYLGYLMLFLLSLGVCIGYLIQRKEAAQSSIDQFTELN